MVAKKESKKIDVRQKTKKKVKLTKRPSEVSVDNLRWFVLFLAAFLLLALVLFWAVELVYAHKVAYGLKLGGDNLGGMTREELNDYLEGKRVNIVDGLKMTGDNLDENTVYFLGDMGIWLDIDKCGSDIWGYGKYNSWLTRTLNRARAVSGSLEFKCQVDFDRLDYNNWLGILREKVNRPAVSASIEKRDGELVIIYSKEGLVVDESRLLNDLEDKLSVLDFGVVDLVQVVDSPAISDEMALATRELAQREINQSMQWVYEDWVIDVYDDVIFDMLYFEQRELNEGINQNYFKPNEDGQVMYVGYDLSAVDKYLNDNAWMFEDKPVDAKLAMMEDGPVVIQEGTTGQMVDRTRLIEYLELHMGENKGEVELPVELMESVISGMNIDDLGIKELIASGSSDFSYSPANRIHNIGVGADNFDGMVVAPGEEFSFTKLLGSVDAASGYLPELVIAGNETRPEYGGGLCQVSTTMYRAALDAGFPITARSPHRYRVSYYEPAGLDATVYIPNPDLRFVNDTKHYILIEAVMNGSILTFNFYGTSDGRQVEITQPNIFNITSPPAPEYIYTSGLASGQKVQVDSAHYGADSIFYRYITYANGETKEEEVFSRYQAWPAKFKVGEGEVDEGGEDDGKVDEVIIDDEDAGLPDVDGEEDVSQVVG